MVLTFIKLGITMQGVLVLSCWVLGALQGAVLILVPEMMLKGHLTALQLAIPLSIGTFVFMFCSGKWGQVLDNRHIAQKPIIVVVRWVLFGFLVSQLVFVSLLQFTALYGVTLVFALSVSRILHGVFCSAIIPSTQLTLSRFDKKGDRLVWASIATNIGRITAPLLTFVPLDINYFSLWFIAVMTFSALIFACIDHGKNEIYLKKLDYLIPKENNPEIFSLFKNPFLISVCCAALLISLFSSQLQFSLGPLFLAEFSNAKLASGMTATLLFSASASALFSLFVVYRPLSRYPKVFMAVIATGLIVGSFLFVTQQHLVVSVILLSSTLSMVPVWYSALAIHASEHNKARTSAVVSQGHTLGNACGGVLGGALLTFGQSTLLSSFGLFTVLILIACSVVYHRANNLNKTRLLKINNI